MFEVQSIKKFEQKKEAEFKIGDTFEFADSNGIVKNWRIAEINNESETVRLETEENGRFQGGNMPFSRIREMIKQKKEKEKLPQPGELVRVEFSSGNLQEGFEIKSIDEAKKTALISKGGKILGNISLEKIKRSPEKPEEREFKEAA